MNKKPHIKILILNWNGSSIISRCIDSAQNINYQNYSIDIIDNGSEDDSCEIIRNNYPNVVLHTINQNLGYAKGYNFIFEKLKNDESIDYYLILNNDTVINDNLLDSLYINSLKYGPDNIYGPKIKYLYKKSLWFSGGYYNKYLGFTKHIGIREFEDNIFYKTNKTDYISGCCMLVKKNLVEKLNGFSEIFYMYYEDVDLCHRGHNIGIDCYVIDDSVISHDVSYTLGGNSLIKIYYQFVSKLKFVFKSNNLFVFLLAFFLNIFFFPLSLIKFFMNHE